MVDFSRGDREGLDLIDTGEALALRLADLLGLDPADRPPVEVYIGAKRHLLTGYEIDTEASKGAGIDMLVINCTIHTPSQDADRWDPVTIEFGTGDDLAEARIIYDECE
jgi:hypothetical protein